MNIIMTCRECGHREFGSSENKLMTRIKMLNHVEHKHPEIATTPARVSMLTREELTTEEQFEKERYNLEASY